jgi:hypothetical protein
MITFTDGGPGDNRNLFQAFGVPVASYAPTHEVLFTDFQTGYVNSFAGKATIQFPSGGMHCTRNSVE